MARRKMPDALIWDYVVRPDPLAWLAACDWVLEHWEPGRRQDVFVRLWRWRATFFAMLLLLVEQTKQAGVGEVRRANVGAASVIFTRTGGSVQVLAMCRSDSWTDYWGLFNAGGQRLLNRRLLRLIDMTGRWNQSALLAVKKALDGPSKEVEG